MQQELGFDFDSCLTVVRGYCGRVLVKYILNKNIDKY
jgi:hypothetical protein